MLLALFFFALFKSVFFSQLKIFPFFFVVHIVYQNNLAGDNIKQTKILRVRRSKSPDNTFSLDPFTV